MGETWLQRLPDLILCIKALAMGMPFWCLSLILQFSGLWTDTADWQGMRRLHRRLLNALKWEYTLALMPPITKWTCNPPHAHSLSAPISHPPHAHTVSQSSQCEYMNTVNCSDRVNYSVCYQATKHQKSFMTSCECEYGDQEGLVQPGGRYGTYPGAAITAVPI